ncbi:hypothetical protein [Rickettsiella endosymbiont of Dermanyssus gallinae]|uniref:hypothetical protein n=1 Tax=Rickettsiella endosymbiont of Dermanyssus gallinae TaxID=2856608 RepID=UPI001C528CBB|nr:hypothetical protein [Rickettsiella endosymbiont of Dermanyssus gallinae]
MKIKSLITMAIIAPLLTLSLAAKAGTCPIPEEFEQKINAFGNIVFTDQDGDFALKEKPIAFAGAIFMHPDEPIAKLRYGKLSACSYVTEEGTVRAALLQGTATKVAAFEANSIAWKKHIDARGNERNNRYDCKSDTVDGCPFLLYHLKK